MQIIPEIPSEFVPFSSQNLKSDLSGWYLYLKKTSDSALIFVMCKMLDDCLGKFVTAGALRFCQVTSANLTKNAYTDPKSNCVNPLPRKLEEH